MKHKFAKLNLEVQISSGIKRVKKKKKKLWWSLHKGILGLD